MCGWMEDKGICIEGNLVLVFHSELEKEVNECSMTDIRTLEMP